MADVEVVEYDYLKKDVLKYMLIKIHNELVANRIAYGSSNVGDTLDDLNDLIGDIEDTLLKVAMLDGATFTGTVTLPAMDQSVKDNTAATAAYVVAAINAALEGISGLEFDGPYDSLEDLKEKVIDPKKSVIYLVKKSTGVPNTCDEYYWRSDTNEFELFGSTEIDLSGYVQKSEMVEMTTSDIDSLLKEAGFNIP